MAHTGPRHSELRLEPIELGAHLPWTMPLPRHWSFYVGTDVLGQAVLTLELRVPGLGSVTQLSIFTRPGLSLTMRVGPAPHHSHSGTVLWAIYQPSIFL